MQSKELAIQIRNLDKVFHLSQASDKAGENHKDFYALRNISLDIHKGEFVGIVGSNGSGKSTLLKILSGILKPTHGFIKLYGNVSSVLELGINLHPDLNGRENALLQLRISGIKKQEIASVLEQVRALSDIGDYFYEPVKFYSNGMFLRLAFAVSFHVKTDILLLDEVLSVGDEEFRLKCISHLKKLVAHNKTILLVTHSPAEAVSLCNSGIWLREGKIEKLGTAPEVLESYMEWQRIKYISSQAASDNGEKIPEKKTDGFYREWADGDSPGNEILSLRSISVSEGNHFNPLYTDEEFEVEVSFIKHSNDISISVLLSVTDQFGQQAFLCHNLNNAARENHQGIFKQDTGLFKMKCFIPANFLAAGRYKLTFQFGKNPQIENPNTEEAFRYDDNVYFYLQYRQENTDYVGKSMNGAVRPAFKWLYAKAENK